MVKTKNRKRISADVLTVKKTNTKAKKHNPFEVHTNKEKFTIMGRQLKHDKGMPGVSRAKAQKRRQDTLGQEYLQKNKNNSFRDRRIGETTMTREEAASARFIAERLNQQKTNKRDSLFNLNDDDDLLTHKGQTLEEIEQFGDTVSDDGDDDDDEIGKLDDRYTGVAHFGGADLDKGGADRQTAIDDLIADQKRRKQEISREKEEVSELTHQLDADWKALIPLMAKMSKEDEKKPKPDDYDRALREMIFEPRGDVSDRLKSEAEIVKVEKDKLEKMERERQERMLGVTEEEKKLKHRSADDLDDGYFLQPVVAETGTVAYAVNGKTKKKAESDDSDEDEALFGKAQADLAAEDNSEEESDDGEEGSEDESGVEEESEDDADNLSDLKDDSDDDAEEAKVSQKRRNTSESTDTPKKPKTLTEEERREMMAKAAAELPYTFELPESYDDLEFIFKDRNAEFQSVILERMIKCNHPKIVHENKSKMVTLFGYLLQHINDTFEVATADNVDSAFRALDRLCPFLHDLAQINPVETTQCFLEVIKEKQNDFRGGQIKHFPTLDTLVFLKLAGSLYSTSDYRHKVITPCYVFISQILSRCRIVSRADIASGLFLATIALEYAELSKRFLPAVLNFIAGVIFLSVPKRPIELIKAIPPFKSSGDQSTLLVVESGSSQAKKVREYRIKSSDLVTVEIDEPAKVGLLNVALNLARDVLVMLEANAGAQYFVTEIERHLTKLDFDEYPGFVEKSAKSCVEVMDRIRAKPIAFIVPAEKKPKALRMLEPKFEKVYDDKRSRRPGNKDKLVQQGMMRKIKSETRGAIREIRRDNAFLAKMQLKKQMIGDAERKEKVRRIFSEASIQQGELNALDRKKKHM